MLDTVLIASAALLAGATLGFVLGRRSVVRPISVHPFRTGLAAGAGFAVLLGTVAWLMGGDSPDSAPPPIESSVQAPTPEPHPSSEELSPALAARDRHLLANPEDLDARREMALLLIAEERYMDALGQADRVLERKPGDPTALYVQGVVRLTMGQRDSGVSLLEQALRSDPHHIHSLIALGTVHLQDGDGARAVTVLERALNAAGGRHSGIEAKLSRAREMTSGS